MVLDYNTARNKWIASAFPKFSSKARGGKAVENMPPPHTIKAHGKYDLHIGPHVFSNTALFEAHYLPPTGPDNSQEAQCMSLAFRNTYVGQGINSRTICLIPIPCSAS